MAKTRLLMPLKVSRLEKRVEDIEKKLVILTDNTSELVFLLKSTFGANSTNKLPSQPIEDQKYIP